jgi:hypothetical protein
VFRIPEFFYSFLEARYCGIGYFQGFSLLSFLTYDVAKTIAVRYPRSHTQLATMAGWLTQDEFLLILSKFALAWNIVFGVDTSSFLSKYNEKVANKGKEGGMPTQYAELWRAAFEISLFEFGLLVGDTVGMPREDGGGSKSPESWLRTL